jgi:CheY-like chemotaxis protein
VLSDPTRFRQIVSNLVSNAIKFTCTGRVVVRVRYKDSQLSVSVHDTGPGIDEETLGRLFRSFTQADASITRTHGGTGLGLKISRDLAVLMGGKLGEGSMFWLRLPAEVIQPAREQTIAPVEHDAVPLRGARVLVVEDGEDNARLATFSLERAGAEVERACHGQEAVDLVRAGAEFDVILMDIQMPIMDGYEATRLLREEGCTTPIIAATASVLLADRDQCIDAGCDGFLPKPYKRAELVEQCRSMIGRADHGQAA